MWNFLGFMRKSNNNTNEPAPADIDAGPKSSFAHSHFAPSTLGPSARGTDALVDPAATYRELVKTMYRDTIRIGGIPKDWLACEVLTLAESGKARFHIQFVVRHWDQEFLNYMPAFQKSFTDRVQRFSPALTERIHSISWRFSSRSGCPVLTLPPADHWSQSARKQRQLSQKVQDVEQFLQNRSSTQQMEFYGFQDTRPMSNADLNRMSK
jgi:hypothetical protein